MPPPKPPTEPVLCPEQAELVELAASGRNIFYTGSAGCGKSTVLHAIRKRLLSMGKIVRVMAPTGRVALSAAQRDEFGEGCIQSSKSPEKKFNLYLAT